MAIRGGKPSGAGVAVRTLGPFAITLGENTAGPWPRPTAKRLCELVLVSAGQRIGREAACEALFPNLSPEAASNALSKALTLARSVLSRLGAPAAELLEAENLRDDLLLIAGGPRVTNLLAAELGYDAGFGRGTLPSEVATFIARRFAERARA